MKTRLSARKSAWASRLRKRSSAWGAPSRCRRTRSRGWTTRASCPCSGGCCTRCLTRRTSAAARCQHAGGVAQSGVCEGAHDTLLGLRRYSLHRFAQDFGSAAAVDGRVGAHAAPQSNTVAAAESTTAPAAPPGTLWDALCDRYRVRRLFRRVGGTPAPHDPMDRVRWTLLEYGHLGRGGSGDPYRSSRGKGGGTAGSSAGASGRDGRSGAEEGGATLVRTEGSGTSDASTLSAHGAASPTQEHPLEDVFHAEPTAPPAFCLGLWLDAGHIDLGASGVLSAASQGDGVEQLDEASRAAVEAHKKQVTQLTQTAKELEARRDALGAERDVCLHQLDQLNAALRQEQEHAARIHEEMAELRSKTAASPLLADAVARLERLVEAQQSLEQEKLDFKARCKQQRAALRQEISDWEQRVQNGVSPDQSAQECEAEELLAHAQQQLGQQQALLAFRNRAVAMLRRRLDEIPTRAELVQYEKRFEDLGDQVESKLAEERKYFATFNTLSKVKEFLTKEVSLLNSIHDQYEKIRLSPVETRQAFVDSMKGVAAGVRQSAAKVQQATDDKLSDLHIATQQHARLLQQQRQHYAWLKAFQEECQKGEQLRALLQVGKLATPLKS
eukprot:jgi/Mesvir1/19672/Mv09946-RA.2